MAKPKKRPATAPAYRPDKKTKSVPAAAAKKTPTRIAAPTSPPKAAKKEKRKTMSEEFDELRLEVDELTEENARLKDRVAELEGGGAAGAPPRRWVRGKLPGEKLIKTDSETGALIESDQAEIDSLA